MKEIVIKIPDDLYDAITNPDKWMTPTRINNLIDAVLHGKVLPKGHGRLIDGDNIPVDTFFDEWDIPNAQTLVEEDKDWK